MEKAVGLNPVVIIVAILTINNIGDLIASGEATFSKLNLSLVQPAFAISPTEVVTTGSAGVANIQTNNTELTINNKSVTQKSLIYITQTSATGNQVLFLLRQVPGVSFTVGLKTLQSTIFRLTGSL